MKRHSKNLHLTFAAITVIIVGLIYGYNPSEILPEVLGFEVINLELKNFIRAIMGLYLTMGIFWLLSIKYPGYQQTATLTIVLFMGGLALGRIISTVVDGVSYPFTIGLAAELILMFWGIYNLKK